MSTETEKSRSRPGPKPRWIESLRLPLAAGTTARLDAVRADGEDRLTVIRQAIETELTRREKAQRREP